MATKTWVLPKEPKEVLEVKLKTAKQKQSKNITRNTSRKDTRKWY